MRVAPVAFVLALATTPAHAQTRSAADKLRHLDMGLTATDGWIMLGLFVAFFVFCGVIVALEDREKRK